MALHKGGLKRSVRGAGLHACKRRQLLVGNRDLQDSYNVHLQSHTDYVLEEAGLKRVVRIQLEVDKQETSCECKMKNPANKTVM